MSSKEQLNNYVKRLKENTKKLNAEIARMDNTLRCADESIIKLNRELSKLKSRNWIQRLFK